MKQDIHIHPSEDIQSVLEKIRQSEAEEINLVVPTGARVLQNIVDAHLIKDAAEENEKNLTVITSDLMGKIFSERAGLAVARNDDYEDSPSMATQAIASTGRISDIIPRRRGIPVGLSSNKKQPAVLAKAKTGTRPSSTAKSNNKKAEDFYLKNKNK